MAVGLFEHDDLWPVEGLRLSATYAGIRRKPRDDVTLIEISENATVAASFTLNRFCAAPVQLAKLHLAKTTPRYLLINAGNANAGTGEQGMQAARQSCSALASAAKVSLENILPFSTGVIGEQLPVDKLTAVIPSLLSNLSADNWPQAAQAIMTTDTLPKAISRRIDINGKVVTITGITKGAGMICPNMATMLSYIATDAGIAQNLLNQLHREAIDESFNRITIDGDTSTNDAAVLIATNKTVELTEKHAQYTEFKNSLLEVYRFLAQAIIRDAEGANKFVAIKVHGGRDEKECLVVAYTVAHSPLVKTALYASDANWGRILAAVGRAPIDELDVNGVSISINDVVVLVDGARSTSYTEAQGAAAMQPAEITIVIDLSRGAATATVWTSDLSHDYVTINAEYRT
ncbi:MAG: bifunctional glutamate N-acetyltransferase/amino-acid acetyltransferase ArgJ [Gammaproteobacteria bacterium]|nr:bifunctional glutamate N-acetyltransferase/amino-acid acetyltransferase ArgJ [Gammaproteobacteria bacterium]